MSTYTCDGLDQIISTVVTTASERGADPWLFYVMPSGDTYREMLRGTPDSPIGERVSDHLAYRFPGVNFYKARERYESDPQLLGGIDVFEVRCEHIHNDACPRR